MLCCCWHLFELHIGGHERGQVLCRYIKTGIAHVTDMDPAAGQPCNLMLGEDLHARRASSCTTSAAVAGLRRQLTHAHAWKCRLLAEQSKAAHALEELSRVQRERVTVELPPALLHAGRPAQWDPQQLLDAQLTWPMPVSDLLHRSACFFLVFACSQA